MAVGERKEKKRRHPSPVDGAEHEKKIQGVIFIQHTMVIRMRDKLQEIEKVGKFEIKLVVKTRDKVVDLLLKLNPWSNEDCGRMDCLLCNSTGEKERRGACKKWSVVYETYCITCEENKSLGSSKNEGYTLEEGNVVIRNVKKGVTLSDEQEVTHALEERTDGNVVKSMEDGKPLSDEQYGTYALEEQYIMDVVKRI